MVRVDAGSSAAGGGGGCGGVVVFVDDCAKDYIKKPQFVSDWQLCRHAEAALSLDSASTEVSDTDQVGEQITTYTLRTEELRHEHEKHGTEK
jgi:hypothetical protein